MSNQDQPPPNPSESSTTPAGPLYKEAMRSLKLDAEGVVMLAHDGVMRSFDGTYERNVIDAVAFSPAQIKSFLQVPRSLDSGD